MHFINPTADPVTACTAAASADQPSGVGRRPLFAMLVLFAISWAATCPAAAQTETVLHSFNGNDGAYPFSRLTIDSQGNLYATTGGTLPPTVGSVFELSPAGHLTVFVRRTPTGICDFCIDNLLRDGLGNLYFSDAIGGKFGNGAVYKLAPAGIAPVALYSFTGGADGKYPNDGLIADDEGNLYGTTGIGGAFGKGVVFKLTPSGTETVLYSFTGGADGGEPWGRLLRDSQGNFNGATYVGGGLGVSFGTVFRLSPSGVLTVLHTFTGGSDGGHPNGDFIADAQGNLYSTTPSIPRSVHGTVYKITQQGVLTVLHTFTGSDGFDPRSGVIMDASGNLYGTTWTGGAFGDGVVYELSANGTLTLLHSFSGSDGSMPAGGLVFDGQGNLYGTAAYGGTSDYGVVFKLTR